MYIFDDIKKFHDKDYLIHWVESHLWLSVLIVLLWIKVRVVQRILMLRRDWRIWYFHPTLCHALDVILELWLISFRGILLRGWLQTMLTTSSNIIMNIFLNHGWSHRQRINHLGDQDHWQVGITAVLSWMCTRIGLFHCIGVFATMKCQPDLQILMSYTYFHPLIIQVHSCK